MKFFSNRYAFAALKKKNNSVVTWGNEDYGGDHSIVASELASNVKTIFSARYAFAALKKDGSVVTWGYDNYGGDSSDVSSELSSRVEKIFANDYAFVAIKTNGLVVTWGVADYGGDSSIVARSLVKVQEVFSTRRAFVALKRDGSSVAWGQDSYGGDDSGVDEDLEEGVRSVVSTDYAFAALKDDDSVVTWGRNQYGGDSSAVAEDLEGIIKGVTWNPTANGKVGINLALEPVNGMLSGDIATYIYVSGDCHFGNGTELAERTLTFTNGGDCVVKATVDRVGYDAWDSGEITIKVALGALTGLGWTPSTSGTVGEALILADVTGFALGDVVTYSRVSGNCKLNKQTLTFEDVGACVVKATVERTGYKPWDSGAITINVGSGTLTGLGWTPSTSGTVGEALVLADVTGFALGDVVTYSRVSGSCKLNVQTLTFEDVGTCLVKVTIERTGYKPWDSGAITINVGPGTLTGLGWTPSTSGTVGEALVLADVTGFALGDVVTYSRVSGSCKLNVQTLTFEDVGTCVVKATVERTGYKPWDSGAITINVAPGTLTGLGWTPLTSGTVGEELALVDVTGFALGDIVTYSRVSGNCKLNTQTLTFEDVGTCVVKATVERTGYKPWDSGAITINVAPGTLTGLGWTPLTSGTVGEELALVDVTGFALGDIVTYSRVSGNCKLNTQTLTFEDVGTCVVKATVERTGYKPWDSGAITINVAPGTLTGLGWTPSTSGTVGEALILADVTGFALGDVVTYSRVSGNCKLNVQTLTFEDVGACVVKATVERTGYNLWESGTITINVAPGTLTGLGWTPLTSGTVGEALILADVTGVAPGDVVTYSRVSGNCKLNKQTLTFEDVGACVVKATVERTGYNLWESGTITINVAPGTLTGLGWTPLTSGTVGEALILADVTGVAPGDVVTYSRVSGNCKLNKQTLTFEDVGACVVKATVERTGYNLWESGTITINVAPGTLTGLGWTPLTSGTVGEALILADVTGFALGDVVTYSRVSGNCKLNKQTLTFEDVGTCVVKATVERTGYKPWDSGAITINVAPGTLTGLGWVPSTSGTVGEALILADVTGFALGDVVTYSRVSGNCKLNTQTLTFEDVGACVVKATVERTGYKPWDSGAITINVVPGTLTGLGWAPSTSGTVGEELALVDVTGFALGDVVTYSRVSGNCKLNVQTLTFEDVGTCVVKATVERTGYRPWDSGAITINVAPGTLTGLGWAPSTSGTVGEELALVDVTGVALGDVVTYSRVSGNCKLNTQTLTFEDVGTCVVKATVERTGYRPWDSGAITINVVPGTLTGLGWVPSTSGTVGEALILADVTGFALGDVVTYSRVSGNCKLNTQTLTFEDVGTCVVKATVERTGYKPWDSGAITINVAPGTLTGLGWVPSTSGTVGEALILADVTGFALGDVVTYSRVSGNCKLNTQTLTFEDVGACEW